MSTNSFSVCYFPLDMAMQLENEMSNPFHSELEGHIKILTEQLQKALKDHQDVRVSGKGKKTLLSRI